MGHVPVPQECGDVARGSLLHPADDERAATGAVRRSGGQRLPRLHLRGLSQEQGGRPAIRIRNLPANI